MAGGVKPRAGRTSSRARSGATTPRSAWKAPDPGLMSECARIVARLPGVESRTMFGCPAAFIRGNMFAGVFGDSVFVRLDPATRERALGEGTAVPFAPMPGRVMKEYVALEASVASSAARLRAWIAKGFRYAATLPPKGAR